MNAKMSGRARNSESVHTNSSEFTSRENGCSSSNRSQVDRAPSRELSFGYFDEPISVAPHLSERALLLRDQHRELYEEIRGLADMAEHLATEEVDQQVLQRLASLVSDFNDRLQQHESYENELIVQAYSVDIGVGD